MDSADEAFESPIESEDKASESSINSDDEALEYCETDNFLEIPDEEFIPGPDDIEDSVLSLEEITELELAIPRSAPEDIVFGRDPQFAATLHSLLANLTTWASDHMRTWTTLAVDERAMTKGAASLLCNVERGLLVDTLLAGIPLQVQRLLSKPSWTIEDLLALPLVNRTGRKAGIYINFVTSPTGCDA